MEHDPEWSETVREFQFGSLVSALTSVCDGYKNMVFPMQQLNAAVLLLLSRERHFSVDRVLMRRKFGEKETGLPYLRPKFCRDYAVVLIVCPGSPEPPASPGEASPPVSPPISPVPPPDPLFDTVTIAGRNNRSSMV